MDHPGINSCSRAGQNLYSFQDFPCESIYQLSLEIPKQIFIDGYPDKIETIGDLLQKTRMDQGLELKQLQDVLGADENSITNWELRGVYPKPIYLKRIIDFIKSNHAGPIPESEMHELCFAPNPAYPKTLDYLGDRIRAARLENFMTIKELSEELGVNECTVAKWERGGSQPMAHMLERIQSFLADHQSGTTFQ